MTYRVHLMSDCTPKNVCIKNILKDQDKFHWPNLVLKKYGVQDDISKSYYFNEEPFYEENNNNLTYINDQGDGWILYSRGYKPINFIPIKTTLEDIPKYIKKHLARSLVKKRILEHYYLSAFLKMPQALSAHFKWNEAFLFYEDENNPNSSSQCELFSATHSSKSWLDSMFLQDGKLYSCFDVHILNPFNNGSNHDRIKSLARAAELSKIFDRHFIKWKKND